MKQQKKEFILPKSPIPVLIFEEILKDLGITKTSYTLSRGKNNVSWFYNVLRKRGYLNLADIKALVNDKNSVSMEEFMALCKKHGVIFDEDSDITAEVE